MSLAHSSSLFSAPTEQKSIPAQALQNSMYLFEKSHPGTSVYHRITALELKGKLDIKRLRLSLAQLVKRHPALQSCFTVDKDGNVAQNFKPIPKDVDSLWPLTLIDASTINPKDAELGQMLSTLERLHQEKILIQPFSLETGPLWRFCLIKFTDNYYQLALTFHHIITDLASETLFLQDLAALYNSKPGKSPTLVELTPLDAFIQPKEAISENISYWQKTLLNLTPISLKSDLQPSDKFCFKGNRIDFKIDAKHCDQLKQVSKENNVSLNTWLTTALFTLLHRYTKQSDICIGMVSANRRSGKQKTDDITHVSCRINTIPLRANLAGNPTFDALAQQIKKLSIEGLQHQAPLDLITKVAIKNRQTITNPCSILIAFNGKKYELKLNGIETCSPVEPNLFHSRFENFGFNICEEPDGSLSCYFEYNADLFSSQFITRFKTHFIQLLADVTENPGLQLSDILITTPEEQKLISQFNATEKPLTSPLLIHELLSYRAKEHPDDNAWVFHPDQESKPVATTFSEADALTDKLAAYLNHINVGTHANIGICVTRSPSLMNAIFSAWKAGGTIVPLETKENNKDLIYYKLSCTQTKIIFVDNKTIHLFTDYKNIKNLFFINLDQIKNYLVQIKNLIISYKKLKLSSHNLAYINFTSGTSGDPKGAEISHGNLVNLINEIIDRNIKDGSKVFSSSAFTFDAFIFELIEALAIKRGELHFTCDELRASPEMIVKLTQEHNINCITLIPKVMEKIKPNTTPSWTYPICMGASPSEELIRNWLGKIKQEYGTTETTICATRHHCSPGEPHTSIGRPIINYQIYILDGYGNICPPGIPGRIFIAGAGLARGYAGNPFLTQEKFIWKVFNKDRFRFENAVVTKTEDKTIKAVTFKIKNSEVKKDSKKRVLSDENDSIAEKKAKQKEDKSLLVRLYDTGDVGVYLANEKEVYSINFLGRADRQVKLNGIRVELDGLEAALRTHPEIKDVTVIQEPVKKNLIAYFVPRNSDRKLFTKDINKFLSKTPLLSVVRLHGAMSMTSLPLNTNGKVDNKALPEYKQDPEEIIQPKNTLQKALHSIWAEVINISEASFGIDHSFTAIGGDSLDLTYIINLINKRIPLKNPIKKIEDLFPSEDVTIEQQEKILLPLLNMQKEKEIKKDALKKEKEEKVKDTSLSPARLSESISLWSKSDQESTAKSPPILTSSLVFR